MMMVTRPAASRLHRVADALLGAGVDRGGRVVEDEDGGAENEGAGDGHALALAAGERGAALADHGLVVVRQAHDVVGQLGVFGGAVDALLAGPGVAVGDVVLDRGREEERVLLHHGDRLPQRLAG